MFRARMPRAQWTSIETGSTGLGVPDAEACFPGGLSFWCEFKLTSGYAVELRAEQAAWADRRSRLGGRCWIAVRRKCAAGPRRGPAVDDLWLVPGCHALELRACGLRVDLAYAGAMVWRGGPARWAWGEIEKTLLGLFT